jgi:putative nucleotidyltransferase with HDIG domain
MPVRLPRGGTISVTFAVDFACLLLFGPAVVAIVNVFSYLFCGFLNNEKEPIIKKVFNISQGVICVASAGIVYEMIGGKFGQVSYEYIFAIFIAALVYFVINTTAVTIIISMVEEISPWGIWLTNIRLFVPNTLALAPMGLLMAGVYQFWGWLGVVIFFVPLMLARHSFKLYMNMRDVFLNTIKALSLAIEAKDNYTRGHSERVAEYSFAIARRLKLPEDQVETIRYMALLHDIGKIGIEEYILNKSGQLTTEEYARIKEHAVIGSNIVKEVEQLGDAYLSVRHHHERFDGAGYPDGLKGDEIPLGARIIAVADTFDAMTSDRIYRNGLSSDNAIAELQRVMGRQLDPSVVKAFLAEIEGQVEIQYSSKLAVEN